MENPETKDAHSSCGCARGSCRCHCLAKIAIGLWLLLVGAVIGYFIGRGCSYHRYHEMIACPMPVAPMENAAPGNPGKPQ